jgi:hypothetical protein
VSTESAYVESQQGNSPHQANQAVMHVQIAETCVYKGVSALQAYQQASPSHLQKRLGGQTSCSMTLFACTTGLESLAVQLSV